MYTRLVMQVYSCSINLVLCVEVRFMDIEANVKLFLSDGDKQQGLEPQERFASFDFCYNYFQLFRETGCTVTLAAPDNIQQSCLQLGFYLASWGMLRGSSFLATKSAKFYEPLINYIANAELVVWDIDVDSYTDDNIESLLRCVDAIARILRDDIPVSGTLVTKIMLGVFGNVPAFDKWFVSGSGIRWTGRNAFQRVGNLNQENRAVIDSCQIPTLDFVSGQKTHRFYSKAKIIDMACFVQGKQT